MISTQKVLIVAIALGVLGTYLAYEVQSINQSCVTITHGTQVVMGTEYERNFTKVKIEPYCMYYTDNRSW